MGMVAQYVLTKELAIRISSISEIRGHIVAALLLKGVTPFSRDPSGALSLTDDKVHLKTRLRPDVIVATICIVPCEISQDNQSFA